MPKMALVLGSYQSRSLIASAQRCVNLYMEKNPEDAQFPYTCYTSPGLTTLATVSAPIATTGWRGLYTASNNQLYGACDNKFYLVNADNTLTLLGTLQTYEGQVSMVDNGTDLIAVDGSSYGYLLKLSDSSTFGNITQTSFYGGDTIIYSDGYFIVNRPGTTQFYLSTVNTSTFDSLDFASKSSQADLLTGVAVAERYLYLFGVNTTEIWYNSGATAFPFARLPGTFIQFGCSAAATIRQMNSQCYWLSQSPDGHALVCTTNQLQAVIISTPAVSYAISSYDTISDAVGFTYQMDGHQFYVLRFPSADKTWQYDTLSGLWTELVWSDIDGNEHQHRAACHAFAYGKHFVGDWENGKLYQWDMDKYSDDGENIVRIRSFPHGADDNSARVMYREFIAAMECGNGVGDNSEVPVMLRWSDTKGKTWGSPIIETIGAEGDYLRSVQFQRLGMARDRVFEISWSAAVRTALCGAWIQTKSARE